MVFALVLVLVLSVIAASLLFMSKSETMSSYNYRIMSDARYGAESAVNSAANYLVNTYTPPGTGGPDQYINYTQLTLPVQIPGSAHTTTVLSGGQRVALTSGGPAVPFAYNYPAQPVQNAFNGAVAGTIKAGTDVVNYTAYATLLSMEQLPVFGKDPANPGVVQTWLITGHANVPGVVNAQVEVSAVLEQAPVPTFQYAAFATSNGCGALKFSGGGTTSSYDSASALGANGYPVTQNSDGNVGSNGNLNEVGAPTIINGTMSTPATGVGNCSAGNVTPWSSAGNAQVTGGIVQLPQTVNYPPPTVPPPGVLNETLNGGTTTLPPGSYNDITLTGNATLQLQPGTYNINSLTMNSNNSSIVLVPDPITGQYGPVILNVTGGGSYTSNPVTLGGNSITNPSFNAEDFQIVYAGTGTIQLDGNSKAAGIVYAPNATVNFVGGSNWYGSVIGQFVDDKGGTAIHYDRRLQKELYTLGNWELDSFTWKKY